ncbi:hypothetical protein B0H19DRAFT_415140 [Mycena capillaripes]|nr:hypothetical protein B0H19DRAFT_415140 [Mycena capillaripes]
MFAWMAALLLLDTTTRLLYVRICRLGCKVDSPLDCLQTLLNFRSRCQRLKDFSVMIPEGIFANRQALNLLARLMAVEQLIASLSLFN